MMSHPTLVSVAIPTYNQSRYILETINSVLSQKTSFQYEIVIGDDHSTDNSGDLLTDLKNRYPHKIRVIFHENNLGLLLNLKEILSQCQGKYIALLGGDDLFASPDKLQKQVDIMEKDHHCGLVHTNGQIINEEGTLDQKRLPIHQHLDLKEGQYTLFERLLLGNFLIASSVCFRADLFKQHIDLKKFRDLGFLMEDYPSWLELARYTKFKYLNECLILYRVREDSLSNPSFLKKRYLFLKSIHDIKFYYMKKYGGSSDLNLLLMDSYSFFKLRYSFLLGLNENLDEEFHHILKRKGWRNVSLDIYLYFFASKNNLFKHIVKFIHAFKNKFFKKVSFQKVVGNELSEW